MNKLNNDVFTINVNSKGIIEKLVLNEDKDNMNWVIDPNYIKELGYDDSDRLFGCFTMTVNGKNYSNQDTVPELYTKDHSIEVRYKFEEFELKYTYILKDNNFIWSIKLRNHSEQNIRINKFYVWLSLAYIMFRDKNVNKNIEQSCAFFPSVSTDFTRIEAVKRNNKGPNLGVFSQKGKTLSIGSYCRYENKFLKNISPSLDGLIYHTLVLADSFKENQQNWIYQDKSEILLIGGEELEWEYLLQPYSGTEDFKKIAQLNMHPTIDYSPVITKNGIFEAEIIVPKSCQINQAWIESYDGKEMGKLDVFDKIKRTDQAYQLKIKLSDVGEKKFVIKLDNDREDFVVFNVLEPINKIIESRIDYLFEHKFVDDPTSPNKYAFEPISNQGESLGKLNLILQTNLLSGTNQQQVRKVEKSALYYIKEKWFVDGEFTKPKKIYGGFYRTLDFDYIAHVYFLLSQFSEEDLYFNHPKVYLKWAAEILILRFDESMHKNNREKMETKLPGVFTQYIENLLMDLKRNYLFDEYEKLSSLWKTFYNNLKKTSNKYSGAITEHYYDNAGFGPSCEVLCISGNIKEAEKYGELLLANIGRSNDYRAQNPDRWWEALSFMLHSLWGGLVSYSTLIAYKHLKDLDYLRAAYRSMMPIFYCYDWNAYSSKTKLEKGEGASTYCISNPNMNKRKLSQNRFGQSVFKDDGAVFGGATGSDWDMGEELVAYLNGFGTKTFLYYKENEIKCINGYIEKRGNDYIVTSYAAYPKEYYFLEENLKLSAKDKTTIPSIKIKMDEFQRPKLLQDDLDDLQVNKLV